MMKWQTLILKSKSRSEVNGSQLLPELPTRAARICFPSMTRSTKTTGKRKVWSTRKLRPVIHVSAVNDELLSAVGKLAAEYGKIGGNLNQIARCLNEYGTPYPQLAKELRGTAAELAALKYEVLQKVGGVVGDTQTFQL